MKPIALVCIAKNEDQYIQEWIDYHLKLGFDHIFVYQNNWRASIHENSCVTLIDFDGPKQQVPAYNHFIQTRYKDYGWAAFFDVDEFLVLKKHASIRAFVADYAGYPAIGVNWAFFGDSGLSGEEAERSVLKRFVHRGPVIDWVKSIVRLTPTVRMRVHAPRNHSVYSTHHERFWNHRSVAPHDDIAQLNHYFCKTPVEFREKVARGKADRLSYRTLDEYAGGNQNDVEDVTARDFLYGHHP